MAVQSGAAVRLGRTPRKHIRKGTVHRAPTRRDGSHDATQRSERVLRPTQGTWIPAQGRNDIRKGVRLWRTPLRLDRLGSLSHHIKAAVKLNSPVSHIPRYCIVHFLISPGWFFCSHSATVFRSVFARVNISFASCADTEPARS